jgi:alcohol dehydrogenase class IV
MALINYLTLIQFDAGAIRLVGQECARLNITRPMVVTDKGVRAAGLLDRLTAHLKEGVPVYDGTQSNPTEASVVEATQLYKQHSCDGVIGLGGGSSIDLGKAVALAATHDGPLKSYAVIEGGIARITAAMAPGSRFHHRRAPAARRARRRHHGDGRKPLMISPHILKVAICDPELTWLLPRTDCCHRHDAIAHCTRSSAAFNPPAEGIARRGLRRLMHIERANKNGTPDGEALSRMMATYAAPHP